MLTPWNAFAPDLLAPFFFALVVAGLASEHGVASRAVAKLGYLGDISFCVYLLHWPIALVARKLLVDQLSMPWYALLLLGLTMGASILCHHAFEMPLYRRLVRRGAGRASGI